MQKLASSTWIFALDQLVAACIGFSLLPFVIAFWDLRSARDALIPALASLLAAAAISLVRVFAARYRTRQRIRSGRDRFRLMVEHASDMISLHSRNGNLLFASAAAQKLLGLAPGRPASAALFERVHVQDRPIFLSTFAQASFERKMVMAEFRLQRGADKAEWMWVEMRCAPLAASREATPLQLVAVTREIDARKAREASLVSAHEEAEKGSVVKTRFLANVSHELRTPLNAIIGFSDMLAHPTRTDLTAERRQEYAQLISESGKHLLELVNMTLDLSKIEAGAFALSPEPFQPVELIEHCLTLMQPAAAKAGVLLASGCGGAVPEIYADRRACKQILLNLLSNGIKFSQPGGVVKAGLRAGSDAVTFFVSDTGIGIDNKDLPRLAAPFAQARAGRDRAEGTGLGLSLVKSLAELQGGEFRLASERGWGTTASVTLPRGVQQNRESATPPRTDIRPVRRVRRRMAAGRS